MSRVSSLQIVDGLIVILCMVSEGYAWDPKDAKPVAVLELMEQHELADESQRACWELTMEERLRTPSRDVAAGNYLTLIGMVARKKNEGRMPQWVSDMQQASRGNDSSACIEVASKEQKKMLQEIIKNHPKKNP
jgi:hypothetical protein